jgi:hypothetical protein
MKLKETAVMVAFLLVLGSVGLGYSIQHPETPTTYAQSGNETPVNNTTVNGTILVSQSSQNLIVVTNITNATGNGTGNATNNTTGNVTNNTTNNTTGNGSVTIFLDWIQITPSGSIPHVVQDSKGVQYYAYCLEPSQKAQSGAGLASEGAEQSAVIIKTAKNSDPANDESATSAQMKIWVLVTGGNTNTNTGEGASYSANMSQSEIQSGLNQAKTDLMTEYKVSEDQLGTLVEYKPMDITGSAMVSNLALSVQDTLNIYPGRVKTNISNNTTNTTNQTNQTNETNITNETSTQANTSNQGTGNSNGSGNVIYIILRFFNI